MIEEITTIAPRRGRKPRATAVTSIDAETHAIGACYAALKDLPDTDAMVRVMNYVQGRLGVA